MDDFKFIGISVRTTNENMQAAQDIGQLWQRFIAEDIKSKIPNKVDDSVLSVYTNYEKDHTRPYDTVLGCRVSSLEYIPEGMQGFSVEGATYAQFTTKGKLTDNIVYQAWLDIWEEKLDRLFTADFEEYAAKAQNPADAEVDIFVAINKG